MSPNGSKKIVIQYSSPESYTYKNNNVRSSFFKPLMNNNKNDSNGNAFIVSSSIKNMSPKNIYTN